MITPLIYTFKQALMEHLQRVTDPMFCLSFVYGPQGQFSVGLASLSLVRLQSTVFFWDLSPEDPWLV